MNIKDYVNIKMDKNEPFDIDYVAYEIYSQNSESKSFKRSLALDKQTDSIIEFSLYWNYDIEHMFDLEHIWIYLNSSGRIIDCECSFHGQFIKGLMPDGSNVKDNKVTLYCQPGKHAFSPTPLVFRLMPNYRSVNLDTVGKGGLLITSILEGRMSSHEQLDEQIKNYMQRYCFKLSDEYIAYDKNIEMLEYDELFSKIPDLLEIELRKISHDHKCQ